MLRMKVRAGIRLLFALVVATCLAEVAWWIYFHYRETGRLAAADRALQQGDVPGALAALGANADHSLTEEAHRRLVMFTSEGIALGILVLIGVVFFYLAMLRERRLRQAQERFLTGATHALKTPLATIRLGIESLQDTRTPAERRERYLRAMATEVDRLDRDVGNVLAAAQVGTSRVGLHRSTGDLQQDLSSALTRLQARSEAAHTTIRCDAQSAFVDRDPQAIGMVLENLLDNAIKYSPNGGTIDVSLRASAATAEVRVRDEGIGMDKEEQELVFERFYRGQARQNVGGTGLGLYLARELVLAHGGTIEATSGGPGKGSEFIVRLPLKAGRT